MPRRSVGNERAFSARRCTPGLLLSIGFLVLVAPSRAQLNLGPVTVGAGLRTSFVHTDTKGGNSTDQFSLDDIRLYVNGSVTENIKLMFNTDYSSGTNKADVLDAVGRFEFSPHFTRGAGCSLPPSDRANLAGPFYSHEWAPFTDGIQDGYPFVYQGSDNGVVYWGDFGKKTKVKVSAGAFDGGSATGNPKIIGAARVQVDFWDAEDGYYLNRTYYGDKNLLAIAGATQVQDGHTATTADFILEKKLPNGGLVTIQSDDSNYNRLGGYDAAFAKSQGAYGLGSYLFPKALGIGKFTGKFEILGKYCKVEFSHGKTSIPNYNRKNTQLNFNYVIKQFNARVMTFYEDTRFNRAKPNFWQAGIGLQIQI